MKRADTAHRDAKQAARRAGKRPTTTVADCTLEGEVIPLDRLAHLSSEDLARVVGKQEPGSSVLDAQDYAWRFVILPTCELEHSNEDGEAPDGGWPAAHDRHLCVDREAVRNGSPEYSGRGEWIRDVWGADTRIHPLFASLEDGEYRLWDGYRRLAGAFYYGVECVAVVLGVPKNA